MHEALRSLVLRVLRVPPEPAPPAGSSGSLRVFRASPRYYRYRLVMLGITQAWIVAATIATAVAVHVALDELPSLVRTLVVGLELLGFLTIAGQLVLSWVALRIDWEMRWYMTTDRSLRLREGVWNVREMTLTLANVQNVAVTQGPLQRLLGIADVQVQTAGGGGHSEAQGQAGGDTHTAWFRGVDDAPAIRDLVFERMRRARDAGLGDPDEHPGADSVDATGVLDTLREEARAFRLAAEALRGLHPS